MSQRKESLGLGMTPVQQPQSSAFVSKPRILLHRGNLISSHDRFHKFQTRDVTSGISPALSCTKMYSTQKQNSIEPNMSSTSLNNKAFGRIFNYFIKRNDNSKSKRQQFQGLGRRLKNADNLKIQDTLQSVKSGGMFFENMPMLAYGQEEFGWRQIYLGILSPYNNKYKTYVEGALKQAQKNQKYEGQHTKTEETQNASEEEQQEGEPCQQSEEVGAGLNKQMTQGSLQRKRPTQILTNTNNDANTHISTAIVSPSALLKLSDHMKQLILQEFIDGKMSRYTQRYIKALLKNDDQDVIALKIRKILMKRLLKRMFISELGARELDSTGKIQPPLKATQPHFQLEIDKFTFMNFAQAGSQQISDQLNQQHLRQVNRDRHRRATSMGDMKTKDVGGQVFNKRQSILEFEANLFVDDHYLNRRKSCCCLMCGGEETLAIKKMDKQAMDLLKDNISPMLKASYKMHSRSESKQSSIEKKRVNRQPIESLRTPLSSFKKLKLEKHAEIDETMSDKSNKTNELLESEQDDSESDTSSSQSVTSYVSNVYDAIEDLTSPLPYNFTASSVKRFDENEKIQEFEPFQEPKVFNLKAILQKTMLEEATPEKAREKSPQQRGYSQTDTKGESKIRQEALSPGALKIRAQSKQKAPIQGFSDFKRFRGRFKPTQFNKLSNTQTVSSYLSTLQVQEAGETVNSSTNKANINKLLKKIQARVPKVEIKNQAAAAKTTTELKHVRSASTFPSHLSRNIRHFNTVAAHDRKPSTIIAPYLYQTKYVTSPKTLSKGHNRLWTQTSQPTASMTTSPQQMSSVINKLESLRKLQYSASKNPKLNDFVSPSQSHNKKLNCKTTQFFAKRIYQSRQPSTAPSSLKLKANKI